PEPGIFIDNKIILFDSLDFGINKTKTFSLDLSVNWTTLAPAFTKIGKPLKVLTFRRTAFSALKKNNRSLIYAFGGAIPVNESDWNLGIIVNDFYQIDVESFSISSVISEGITPSERCDLSSIFDDKGKLYIWGGYTRGAISDQAMHIFDTFDSTWNRILPSHVPIQRAFYSVTFRDGKIYYIGGTFANTDECVDIHEILIYDTLNTNDNPWTIRLRDIYITAMLTQPF
ncbi:8671_t:CDS:2, partial [Ambispora gerdemannii]